MADRLAHHAEYEKKKHLPLLSASRNRPLTFVSAVTVAGESTPVIIILAAIYWTRADGGLTIAEAFTSLSIITLSIQPLTMLLGSVMQMAGVFGAFMRLQTFLLLEEQKDVRLADVGIDTKSPKPSSEAELARDNIKIDATPRPSQDIELTLMSKGSLDLDPSKPAVKITGVTYTVQGDEATASGIVLLNDINMTIHQGSLTMIVGRVGCGKSSLLKAIIGELAPQTGSIAAIADTMAYCDQTPWLQNTSVRDNIVVQTHVDEEWLWKVIRACALEEDISNFPLQEHTLVGSGGVALSGGQKQRLVSYLFAPLLFAFH